MNTDRRRFIRRASTVIAATALPGRGWAQPYPARPVRIVVPYPAGGTTDVLTRALGHWLAGEWGQQIIVENRAGAGTQLGAEAVARSGADGYTLLATAEATFVVNPFLYSKLSYDPDAFVPVSGLGVSSQVLVAHPSLPARSAQELIALAKAKPGELNYGTFGLGSSSHLNMEVFERIAGIKLTPVHYNGAAPMMTDLIGGHIPMCFVGLTLAVKAIRAGQLKALGVGAVKRHEQLPDVPTIAESGFPGFQAISWFGLFAPGGTPRDIVLKVNADVQAAMSSPQFRQQFLEPSSLEPILATPEQFAQFVRTEASKWKRVIKEAGISAD